MRRFIVASMGLAFLLGGMGPGMAQVFNEQALKLNKVIGLIESYYVDSVNQKKLVEKAIVNVLKDLDPHSVYIPAEEVKEMNDPLMGNFEGIGIQFNVLYDTVLVISPVSGGPSEKAGILAGDRIIRINGENVAATGITTKKVQDRLMGPKGSKVTVTIRRRGVKEDLDFVITRDKIPIYSLDAAYMVDAGIGYIKLNKFSFSTMSEVNDALRNLRKQGMQDLILDLRGNGGGYMEVAVNLLDKFFTENKLVVYMEGEHSPRRDYFTTSNGELKDTRLVVLMDEGSASASEIVAGAVQDWDRGVIIGRRSFGKGLVQRPFNLPDGAMIRLTIARYYTPSGRSIQKPYTGGYDDYFRDLDKRYSNGEMNDAASIRFPDSLKFNTLVNGRTVYGGGGIMPDIFVPIDTTGYSDYYRDVIRKGIINKFVLDYVDHHRATIKGNYSSFNDFRLRFDADNTLVPQLVDYASKQGLPENKEQVNLSYHELSLLIKALIARDIWDTNEYFEIINQKSPLIDKAVEVLKNVPQYKQALAYN